MFFPQNREQLNGTMCSSLCVQPPISLDATTTKSLPLLSLSKKTSFPTPDSGIHLPGSIIPSINHTLYDTPYRANNRFVQNLRLWPHLDPRLFRLNPTLPPTANSPPSRRNSLVTMGPYPPSPFPNFDLPFSAPPSYGRKMFRCSQCRYITDRRNNLKRHVLTMHQTCSKMLECCGILFHTKASLREHSLIFHFNGYTCHYCGRRFCRKALLKRHLSVHSGQKDYICAVCDYATSHKSNLERHRKVHVRQGADGEIDELAVSHSSDEQDSCEKEISKSSKIHHHRGIDLISDDDEDDDDADDNSDWEINVDDDGDDRVRFLDDVSFNVDASARGTNGQTNPTTLTLDTDKRTVLGKDVTDEILLPQHEKQASLLSERANSEYRYEDEKVDKYVTVTEPQKSYSYQRESNDNLLNPNNTPYSISPSAGWKYSGLEGGNSNADSDMKIVKSSVTHNTIYNDVSQLAKSHKPSSNILYNTTGRTSSNFPDDNRTKTWINSQDLVLS